MSWKGAQQEAQDWLNRCGAHQLKKTLKPGMALDLRPYDEQIGVKGKYRTMILEAARRYFKSKDIEVLLPDFEPESADDNGFME
jgi:hypothetical protein